MAVSVGNDAVGERPTPSPGVLGRVASGVFRVDRREATRRPPRSSQDGFELFVDAAQLLFGPTLQSGDDRRFGPEEKRFAGSPEPYPQFTRSARP